MGPNVWFYVFDLFKNPVFDIGLIFWVIVRCFKVYPELDQYFFGPDPEVVTTKKSSKKSRKRNQNRRN